MMDSSPVRRKRAMEELARGREFANDLQKLFLKCQDNDDSVTTEVLAHEVLNSLINAISILNSGESDDKLFCVQGSLTSSCGHSLKSESPEEITNFPTPKDPKGRCKKRKVSQSWHMDSSNWMMHDGHTWRKYGQKMIYNTKYPRNYYRCTHKTEQGCKATKQVQRIREHPPFFRTTYFGHHTCKNLQQHPPVLFINSTDEYDHAKLLSFGTNNTNKQADFPFFSVVSSLNMKQKCNEEVPSGPLGNHSSSSNSVPLQRPAHSHGDEISGLDSSLSSTYSFSMSVIEDSDEFSFRDLVPPRLEELLQG